MTDHQEFEELFRSTYETVVLYCRRRLGADSWEDTVSEIYRVAWEKRSDFLNADNPIAWLLGVAFRVVSTEFRQKKKRKRLRGRLKVVGQPPESSPEDVATDRENSEHAFAALSRLDDLDREIVRLSMYEELPYVAIAEVVGLTEPAVRTRMYRARKQLQAEYGEISGEEI